MPPKGFHNPNASSVPTELKALSKWTEADVVIQQRGNSEEASVIWGCEMTVVLGRPTISAGAVWVGGRSVPVRFRAVPDMQTSSAGDRLYLAEATPTGDINTVVGTPSNNPLTPEPTAGNVVLYEIIQLKNQTSTQVGSSAGTYPQWIDKRMFLRQDSRHTPLQVTAPPFFVSTLLGNIGERCIHTYTYQGEQYEVYIFTQQVEELVTVQPVYCPDNILPKGWGDIVSNPVGMYPQNTFHPTGYRPFISKRKLPSGEWETPFDLRAAMAGDDIWFDGHNDVVVAVDGDGYIHVAGNCHRNKLHYSRSTLPNVITGWTSPSPLVSNATIPAGTSLPANTQRGAGPNALEDRVTYPQFTCLTDGNLLLTFRHSYSINDPTTDAAQYLYKYNKTSKTWSNYKAGTGSQGGPVPLLDGRILASGHGSVTAGGPYCTRMTVDSAGVVHFWFGWRAIPGTPGGMLKLAYMKSADNGTTWTKADDSALATPVGFGFGDIPFDPAGWTIVPQMNLQDIATGAMAVTPEGVVHILQDYYIDATHQRAHIYRDPDVGAWVVNPLTFPIEANYRTYLFAARDGSVMAVVPASQEGQGHGLRLLDMNPDSPGYSVASVPLVDFDAEDRSEPDPRSQDFDNRLKFVVFTNVAQVGNAMQDNTWTGDDNNYNLQRPHIVDLNLDCLPAVVRGDVIRPHMEIIASVSGPKYDMIVTGSTIVDLPMNNVPIVRQYDDENLYVRLTTRAQMVLGNANSVLRIYAEEVQNDTGPFFFDGCQTVHFGSSVSNAQSPWVPLTFLTLSLFSGRVKVRAKATGAGAGGINRGSLLLEVARLLPVRYY